MKTILNFVFLLCLFIASAGASPTISGSRYVCINGSTSLTADAAGGTWSSGSTSVATVNSSTGEVFGVAEGSSVITYTITGAGSDTFKITVNKTTPTITGNLCLLNTSVLTANHANGVWSISDPSVATITSTTNYSAGDSSEAAVSQVSAGTATVSYLYYGCQATATLNVDHPLPDTISAPFDQICEWGTMTLSYGTPGGIWATSNPSVVTVTDPVHGVIKGVNANGNHAGLTEYISYTLGGNCKYKAMVTMPYVKLTTPTDICHGTSAIVYADSAGGTWRSSNTDTITLSGQTTNSAIAYGVNKGVTILWYRRTPPAYCNVDSIHTENIFVLDSNTSISNLDSTATSACPGTVTNLYADSRYGRWSTTTPSLVSISSYGGNNDFCHVTALSPGTFTIIYRSKSDSTCFARYSLPIISGPSVISGPGSLCVGGDIQLTDSVSGGTWSSSNTSKATVSATGLVHGVSAGTVNITYSTGAGCFTTHAVTVNPAPAAITGNLSICVGSSTTLSDSQSGGTWSSANTDVAGITGDGVVTGYAAGTSVISYSLSAACFTTATVTVSAQPAISKPSGMNCNSTQTLTATPTGGTWSGGDPYIATINSTTGVVTAIGAGTATFTYTSAAGCQATTTVTIIVPVISGSDYVCKSGGSVTLTGTPAGGTWSSSNTDIATVSASGKVTAITGGSFTITYTIGSGCYTTWNMTADDPATIQVCEIAPMAICDTILSYCPGFKVKLSANHTVGGYTWSPAITATSNTSGADVIYTFTAAPTAGVYTITANSGGCQAVVRLRIVVPAGTCYPCDYFKAKAFDSTVACDSVQPFVTVWSNKLSAANISTTTAKNYYIPYRAANPTIDTLAVSPAPGSVFLMGDFVRLVVSGPDSVVLDSCHLFSSPACNTWYGIYVNLAQATVGKITLLHNTMIEHAATAGVYIIPPSPSSSVYSPASGYIINSGGTIYNNNTRGISIEQYSKSVLPFAITNSVFTNRNFNSYHTSSSCSDHYPFRWPTTAELKVMNTADTAANNPRFNIDQYPGMNAATNSRGWAGLYLNIVAKNDTLDGTIVYNPVVVGDTMNSANTNLFDTLIDGAVVSAANAVFLNNIFRCSRGTGDAITLQTEGFRSVKVLGNRSNNTHNRFYNCYFAINGNAGYCKNFYCVDAVFKAANIVPATGTTKIYGNYGIYLNDSTFDTHFISNNVMANILNPITEGLGTGVASCSNGSMIITNNYLTGLLSSTSYESGATGIRLAENHTASACGVAAGNIRISSNYIAGFNTGIISAPSSTSNDMYMRTIIDNNEIVIRKNNTSNSNITHVGIQLTNVRYADSVTHNHVYGDLSTGVTYNNVATYTGFLVEKCGYAGDTAQISCNYVHDIQIGFEYVKINTVAWKKNVMMRNKYGLLLQYTGNSSYSYPCQIGDQGSATMPSDNVWADDGSVSWPGWLGSGISQTFTAGVNLSTMPSRLFVRPDPVPGSQPYYLPLSNGTSNFSAIYTGTAFTVGSSIIVDSTGIPDTCNCSPAYAYGCGLDAKEGGHTVMLKTGETNRYVLFPNPGDGNVTISQDVINDGTCTIRVVNIAGSLIYKGDLTFSGGKSTLQLNGQPAGLYTLIITDANGNVSPIKMIVR